jgi:hypothetical protein
MVEELAPHLGLILPVVVAGVHLPLVLMEQAQLAARVVLVQHLLFLGLLLLIPAAAAAAQVILVGRAGLVVLAVAAQVVETQPMELMAPQIRAVEVVALGEVQAPVEMAAQAAQAS